MRMPTSAPTPAAIAIDCQGFWCTYWSASCAALLGLRLEGVQPRTRLRHGLRSALPCVVRTLARVGRSGRHERLGIGDHGLEVFHQLLGGGIGHGVPSIGARLQMGAKTKHGPNSAE